ncbi:DedA family protein [Levilactobacillus bambusae]|uniref:Alkaline phosphatase n=1 Tax=Levilactobacillus bambusae TaxID=2024736 RepID=A0A2V1MZ16_9LACO|nr:DedA family protein [Levilactobacillus bambusae]PWG00254.1 alkaline phosphatase [Levilactobacillus bambusae]
MDNALITELISQFGYLGIAALIALENLFPPIPSELILTFAGFLTLSSTLTIPGVILAATVGAVTGALILYGAGRLVKAERLERWLGSRMGRYLHVRPAHIQRAQRYFQTHGLFAIFFGRFVPVVRSLISIPAGMSSYSLVRFIGFTFAGTLIWNTVLIFAGHLAGNAWPTILTTMKSYSTLLIIATGFLLISWASWAAFKRRRS